MTIWTVEKGNVDVYPSWVHATPTEYTATGVALRSLGRVRQWVAAQGVTGELQQPDKTREVYYIGARREYRVTKVQVV